MGEPATALTLSQPTWIQRRLCPFTLKFRAFTKASIAAMNGLYLIRVLVFKNIFNAGRSGKLMATFPDNELAWTPGMVKPARTGEQIDITIKRLPARFVMIADQAPK